MGSQYKIIISNKNLYREFELTENLRTVFLGTTPNCEFRLNGSLFFAPVELKLELEEDRWKVSCNEGVYISKGDMRKLFYTELEHDTAFVLRYAESESDVFEFRFVINFEANVLDYNWYVDLNEKPYISIGEADNSDIVIRSKYTQGVRIEIFGNGYEYFVEEKYTPYGLFLNGHKITREKITDYDFISVSDFFFYIKDRRLYFDIKNMRFNGINVNRVVPRSEFQYPKFIRNTRRKNVIEVAPITILAPREKPKKPETNIITTLMPALIMFGLTIYFRVVQNQSGGSYVILSLCTMAMGIITTVVGLVKGKKDYKKETQDRIDSYDKYIASKEEEIQNARNNEIQNLRKIYYSPAVGINKVERFDSDIFDRTANDEDFLDVFLGSGARIAERKVEYKLQETIDETDELKMVPANICDKYKYLEEAPIVLKLKKANAVGIAGSNEDRYQLFKNILTDIVCRQYYADVTMYMLIDSDVEKYDWIRLLPNLSQGTASRNIVFNNASKTAVFEKLYRELSFREETKAEYNHIIVFVLEDNGISNHPISRFIEKAAELKVTFIFFEKSIDYLPLNCSKIIELKNSSEGYLYDSQNESKKERFVYEKISDDKMRCLVEKVAPIHSEEISLESTLRKNISMYELLGIYMASDLNLEKRWTESEIYKSMSAPLGVNAKDEVICLDLHEKAHGPHGLVAGTTGSGKSEILQSYIISAASRFQPSEIGFVIIDFKGGGMANQFKDLPHMIGAITNIDGKEITRSLKSIKAELLKRQELFAKAGVNQIDKYIKLFKEGKVSYPLPHLVIIVDEFAELKAEQPEFMKELISAARIGRSLGVHLILATQKPAGQVNEQIWSNSKFKLCLKVQDQNDSKEVIKSPLAAEIKEPGRAYLQVGNNEIFELFQSAYSGAPAVREDESAQKKFKIYKYGMSGRNDILFEQKKSSKKNVSETELEAIIRHIAEFCEQKGIEKLPNICLPSLLDCYTYDADVRIEDLAMQLPMGIYDDPDHQYQGVAVSEIGRENTMIVGSTQTGKTNYLQLCLRTLASKNSPEEVNFYIMDFGSMILKNFEKLAHVGGVVLASEDEKVKNLFKLLEQEMDSRKNKLMKAGVSSFQAYKEAMFTDMPKIYVMLDNYNVFKELYMEKYEAAFVRICRDGLTLGISVIMTNSSTNGIGYKYMSNFSNRICFSCNETMDYSAMLDRCRMEPKNVPGRILFQADKTIYEAQTYLAFEGEKEIERVSAIQTFVEETNAEYREYEAARKIPMIPEVLRWKEFKTQFGQQLEKTQIPVGLEFASIEPAVIDVQEESEVTVISAKKERAAAFIQSIFAHSQMALKRKCNFYVVDGMERMLLNMKEHPATTAYCIDVTEVEFMLEAVRASVEENKNGIIMQGSNYNMVQNVVILNSKEVIEYISATKPVLELYKDIVTNYKNYGIVFIYGCVENATVAYSGPEILKRIKDARKAYFLDDLKNMKMMEVGAANVRVFAKPLLSDEGYRIDGTEVSKIKLFTKE